MEKIVFMDRDGTINVEKNYLYKTEDFEFIEGSPEAIKLLRDNGFKVVVITNQAGVARGYYSEEKVQKLHKHINERLKEYDTMIDAFYYCPHHPVAGIGYYKRICKCRKPGTLLFETAAEKYGIDKSKSFMIGDNEADLHAGNNFGIKTVLVSTGYGQKIRDKGGVRYDYFAKNLFEAAKMLVEQTGGKVPKDLKIKEQNNDNKCNKNNENKTDKKADVSMNDKAKDRLAELLKRYPELSVCKADITEAFQILKNSYNEKGKLLVAGNGGSASDAEHIVGELMKGFVKKRSFAEEEIEKLWAVDKEYGEILGAKLQGSLPAIALSAQEAISTAFSNDVDGKLLYAQMVNGYGMENDVFLGISTSGNSENVVMAAVMAKAKGMKVIGLTGEKGGKLEKFSDVVIKVPETETFKIQELHLPVYHCLCLMLEETFF